MASVAADRAPRAESAEITRAALVRWSGMASLVAAVTTIVVPFVHPGDDVGTDSSWWVPVHIVYFLGLMLMQLGLVGILAAQLRQAGRLGVAGFLGAFLGTAMILMEGREHLFSPTFGDTEHTHGLWELVLASAVFSVGFIALGVAVRRARVLPAWAGVLLAVGGPVVAFSPPIGLQAVTIAGSLLLGGGLAWIGWRLWAGDARA